MITASVDYHYMRKPHLRCACTKNEDTQIAQLCHRVSHYKVIRDACTSTSPISIHWRPTKLEHVSHYTTHLRRTLGVHVTDLIVSWGL
jgi:hypothetical protein